MIRRFPGWLSEYKKMLEDSPGFDPYKVDELAQLLKKCPVFATAIEKEAERLGDVSERMEFELSVYHRKWYWAADRSYYLFRKTGHSLDAPSSPEESLPLVNLEEEMYCLRQLGIPGRVGMVARTSQQTIRSHLKNRVPKDAFDRIALYEMGEGLADMVMELSVMDSASIRMSREIRLIDEEREKASRQNTAAPVIEKATGEKNPDRETSQTLETREATRETSSTQETSSTLETSVSLETGK